MIPQLIALSLWLSAISISLNNGAFEVSGISPLPAGDPAELFVVAVDGKADLPPLAGTYEVQGDSVRFRPRFPLTPGVRYRAEWRPSGTSRRFEIPKPAVKPTARVERVYPTSDTLPENQLKLYIHFSAPMSRAEAWRRVHLLDDAGKEVSLPFLEIDEELWDPEGRRLTVLFDPGRIKRGLVPHNEVGPPLVAGRAYQLVIDREWQDAGGTPMVEEFRKSFRVKEADRTPPTPGNWKLHAPRARSSESLQVDFPEPLDSALLERLLWVETAKGAKVEGVITVARNETRWLFAPAIPWLPGNYVLKVGTVLEDLAGNRIDRPFDVDTFDRVEMRLTVKTRQLPFRIAP
ncbi:MAG: hypothetical protein HY235_28755 [Acidobacteria bacterium]|nr:hypothetical protein [Acidobacteriota bacterium]